MKSRTITANAVTADASKISGADFFRQVFGGPSREEIYAEECKRCIRAIEKGDTYGFPPLMVADCRKIMADDEYYRLVVERDLARTVELQRAMPSARAGRPTARAVLRRLGNSATIAIAVFCVVYFGLQLIRGWVS